MAATPDSAALGGQVGARIIPAFSVTRLRLLTIAALAALS